MCRLTSNHILCKCMQIWNKWTEVILCSKMLRMITFIQKKSINGKLGNLEQYTKHFLMLMTSSKAANYQKNLKDDEKAKALEATKFDFGFHFQHVPPWNLKKVKALFSSTFPAVFSWISCSANNKIWSFPYIVFSPMK
jgi:hypothetical protein